ncbi:uroporphyrinogen-III synthase [Malikia sp.]|uniref:uroporphyrinogen-III synthase n=1 Tax=Malikia sp. TaxID=2070706 RepID=UPI00262719AB|nr:uroporphyrinogen-III synthase [Malikia sp.]MDD2728134.1 uroporphyrinogen-III synthase [Malikia sp.]
MRRAVVTRPTGEAQRWVSALQRQGWDALALPLIEIAPAADPRPLRQARARLADYHALMFVSAPAVAQFFAGQPWPPATGAEDGADAGTATAAGPRCWAPGPATARALLTAGVPADRIDQPDAGADQYDSESLWRVVGPLVVPGHRLLIVRGQTEAAAVAATSPQGNGRDWLANQCRAHGGSVDWCVAYRRRAPAWTARQREQAQAASRDGSIWLLSSSEAIEYLRDLLPEADWSRSRALATHPRIAQAAARLGFGALRISRPALADVLINLESMP